MEDTEEDFTSPDPVTCTSLVPQQLSGAASTKFPRVSRMLLLCTGGGGIRLCPGRGR